MNIDEAPDILNVDEVAELLRVHRDTIYAAVKEDRIPHFRVRGTIRFRKDRVIEWMNGHDNQGG